MTAAGDDNSAAGSSPPPRAGATAALAAAAMLAFAANSILTRLALAPDPQSGRAAIGAMDFALIRAWSGAAALCALLAGREGIGALIGGIRGGFDPSAVAGLLAYFVGFTLAYVWLPTGTGALILFGCVQITMLGVALVRGERFSGLGWTGFVLAAAGVVALVAPGASAPDPIGALLMAVAGVGWGVYSLRGIGARDPVRSTTSNFVACAPLVLAATAIGWATGLGGLGAEGAAASAGWTGAGILLACGSGALASAVGYVIWYAATPGLGAGRAAATQLSVPILAALGGAALLAEPIDARLVMASVATLGGVAMVLASRTGRRG